jgi:hypothetical protein
LTSIRLNPDNPRLIRDAKFKKLVESIKLDPEFLEKRGIVHADGVILGGNQRYLAIKEAAKDESFRSAYSLDKGEIPASWVQDASDWPEEKRRRFVVIDNNSFGEWDFDLLANNWSDLPLIDLGLDIPKHFLEHPGDKEEITIDDVQEDNPKPQGFIDRRERGRERGKDKSEVNFWVCLVFQSYDQKHEFLAQLPDDVSVKYGMYVDGETLVQALGYDLTPNKQKPHDSRLDNNLTERVLSNE